MTITARLLVSGLLLSGGHAYAHGTPSNVRQMRNGTDSRR